MEFRHCKRQAIAYDVLIIDKKSRELCIGAKFVDVDAISLKRPPNTQDAPPYFEFTLSLNPDTSNIIHVLTGFLVKNKTSGLTIAFITNNPSLKRALRNGLCEQEEIDLESL